jgi:hypothetical protein
MLKLRVLRDWEQATAGYRSASLSAFRTVWRLAWGYR